MNKKADYLFRVAVTCQLAEEESAADPMNCLARQYAKSARLLFDDAVRLPEGHDLFEAGFSAPSAERATARLR